MRHFPEVLAARAEDSRLELDLEVPADLVGFEGHFPGLPILPGVLQIDWSVKLARERLGMAGEFVAAQNLKFAAIVRPGARLTLVLERSGGRLDFAYLRDGRRCSSGTLLFAEP